jgi:hypothetical protein
MMAPSDADQQSVPTLLRRRRCRRPVLAQVSFVFLMGVVACALISSGSPFR